MNLIKNYIKNVCDELKLSKKQIAAKFNKTPRTIDNWARDPEMIPLQIKECLDLMIENKELLNDRDLLITLNIDAMSQRSQLREQNKSLSQNLPEIVKMLSKAIENTKCIETAAELDEIREKLNKLLDGDK